MMPFRLLSPSFAGPASRRALAACALVCAAIAVSACASKPPTPVWQIQASSALTASQSAYLDGDERIALFELNKARAAISRTGNPQELARLELHQCAMQVASLDFQACDAFAPLAASATQQERNYALYLQGLPLDSAQRATLPVTQQKIAAYQQIDAQSLQALASIEEPLSRLVATAALARRAQDFSFELLDSAVDTASQTGWRRPLLAWLLQQKTLAQTQQRPDLVQAINLRIDIVQRQGRAIEGKQAQPATSAH